VVVKEGRKELNAAFCADTRENHQYRDHPQPQLSYLSTLALLDQVVVLELTVSPYFNPYFGACR
jgi:hypothetical protein